MRPFQREDLKELFDLVVEITGKPPSPDALVIAAAIDAVAYTLAQEQSVDVACMADIAESLELIATRMPGED